MKKHRIADFTPLIGIISIIIILTIISTVLNQTSDWMSIMRNFMGYFFLLFGLFKVMKWQGFVMAFKKYDVLAMKSTGYAYVYPLIEMALAVSYLNNWAPILTNSVTLVIMIIGSYGIWKKLQEKEEIPCACLGVVFKLPMTKVTLFEDLLMATMAVIMLITLL